MRGSDGRNCCKNNRHIACHVDDDVAQRRNLLSADPRSELSITAELKGTKPNTDEHAYLRYHQTDVRKAFLSN